MAPIVGENRAIARLGLDRMRAGARPGLGGPPRAGRGRAGQRRPRDRLLRPRPTDQRRRADGRGDRRGGAAPHRRCRGGDCSGRPARDGQQRPADADERDTRTVEEAVRAAAAAAPETEPAIVVRGPWPVGIVGLVAAGSPRTGRARSSSARRSAMSCGHRAGRRASTLPRPSRPAPTCSSATADMPARPASSYGRAAGTRSGSGSWLQRPAPCVPWRTPAPSCA